MTDPISAHVRALVNARRTGEPACATDLPPLPDARAAYAVQRATSEALGGLHGPGLARTWKSGGASRSAVLTHAPLPDAGVWRSPALAGPWPLRMRGIEAEIALRLGRDVDAAAAAKLDPATAATLIDAMCVSLEIVESRWTEGLDAPALAKLADLQSHGALVLGDWVPFQPLDWQAQACLLRIGPSPVLTFTGTHAMGDPTWLLPAWLRHATSGGQSVPAGTVVTTGTWCGIRPARRGDRVGADFPGIGRAFVEL